MWRIGVLFVYLRGKVAVAAEPLILINKGYEKQIKFNNRGDDLLHGVGSIRCSIHYINYKFT